MQMDKQEWLDLEGKLEGYIEALNDSIEEKLDEKLNEILQIVVDDFLDEHDLNKDATDENRSELLFKAREAFFRG